MRYTDKRQLIYFRYFTMYADFYDVCMERNMEWNEEVLRRKCDKDSRVVAQIVWRLYPTFFGNVKHNMFYFFFYYKHFLWYGSGPNARIVNCVKLFAFISLIIGVFLYLFLDSINANWIYFFSNEGTFCITFASMRVSKS